MKKFSINYLSSNFYEKYDKEVYKELILKEGRPFLVLLVQIELNTFAIPFRSNIRHNNAYKFKNSTRRTESITGLDFSKAVIVADNDIGDNATINDKEYVELASNFYIIEKNFNKFVKNYKRFITSPTVNDVAYNKYRFCTLQYFHKQLGI
ncbi:MAG: hypothetical protein R3Y65_06520 [Bacillota bacterium]